MRSPTWTAGATSRTSDAAAVDDGTLYKPVAVDTSIQTSAGMLRHYEVKEGDTLTGIASRFGVSMMTVWWANKLTTKDSLKAGKDLIIPPVNGLVVTVERATRSSRSRRRTRSPLPRSSRRTSWRSQPDRRPGARPPGRQGRTDPHRETDAEAHATNVQWRFQRRRWRRLRQRPVGRPVPGGYVSQYFHYGHYGVDIADDYGSSIVSPRAGTVAFAGWKSNGGGYQVWINHGNGIYSAHHHMSSVVVSSGQSVARASALVASGPAAGRRVRTTTSRSGSGGPGERLVPGQPAPVFLIRRNGS